MRIFHASAANRKSLMIAILMGLLPVLTRFLTGVRVKSQNHHNFPSPALQSTEVTISNQKSIANENINPTQTSAAGITETLRRNERCHYQRAFAKDSDRFSKFSATFDDLMLVDFSKTASLKRRWLNCRIWRKRLTAGAIKSMFSGEKINRTEDRAVLTSRCVTAAIRRLWLMAKM